MAAISGEQPLDRGLLNAVPTHATPTINRQGDGRAYSNLIIFGRIHAEENPESILPTFTLLWLRASLN